MNVKLGTLSEICVACQQPMPAFELQHPEVLNPATGARRHIACEGKPLPFKVFEMNDCDWMAARTAEEALADYNKNYGGDEFEEETPREVSAEAMQRLRFLDDEDRSTSRSFQDELERLIASGAEFPRFFASTEY